MRSEWAEVLTAGSSIGLIAAAVIFMSWGLLIAGFLLAVAFFEIRW